MHRLFGVMIAGMILGGCVMSGPLTEQEAFPVRNQDPRLGLIINEGTAHLNVTIYDRAGRMMRRMYLAGASDVLIINGRHVPKCVVHALEIGGYRVLVEPFFYSFDLLRGRYRVDLPHHETWLVVDRRATDYYEASVCGTARHWGWVLHLNGGQIPDRHRGPVTFRLRVEGF